MSVLLAMPSQLFFSRCRWPTPSSADVEAWNKLDVGTATSTLKLGLFGYDITCVAGTCAEAMDVAGYCATL
jgi:hypothetical protein